MTDIEYPPIEQCLPVGMLTMRVLADIQRWAKAELPQYPKVPFAVLALGDAVIHPWAGASELRLSGRMGVWVCALDDHIEQEIAALAELDEFIERCNAVLRTGKRDDRHPLLASLSGWQAELAAEPLYPELAGLWERKFASCLSAMRHDWVVGAARANGEDPPSTIEEYLRSADSISVWQVHFPRWLCSANTELVEHLDTLVPALDDVAVVSRLANDLAGYARERSDPRENNALMYGVTPDWVREEIDRRLESVRDRLAGLVAKDHQAAIGVLRLADWTVGMYRRTDPRIAA